MASAYDVRAALAPGGGVGIQCADGTTAWFNVAAI